VDGTVNANTTAETTAREAADQTLTSNLDTEITRARAAEALNTRTYLMHNRKSTRLLP
jgi:hypothetical protein